MEGEIDLGDIFFNVFFERILASTFVRFLKAPNPENMHGAKAGARFVQNRHFPKSSKQKLDFVLVFGSRNDEKSRKHCVVFCWNTDADFHNFGWI